MSVDEIKKYRRDSPSGDFTDLGRRNEKSGKVERTFLDFDF